MVLVETRVYTGAVRPRPTSVRSCQTVTVRKRLQCPSGCTLSGDRSRRASEQVRVRVTVRVRVRVRVSMRVRVRVRVRRSLRV